MLTFEGGCRSVITDDGRTDSRRWNLLEGVNSAQTQVDVAQPGKMSVWAFPLDIHYSRSSIHGWPKFQCEALPPPRLRLRQPIFRTAQRKRFHI